MELISTVMKSRNRLGSKGKSLVFYLMLSLICYSGQAQTHSVARKWNEVLLEAIRKDYARPTIHSRNLFHTSAAMYDAWAVYDNEADTYLLGKTVGDYSSAFSGIGIASNISQDRAQAISYSAYRLLSHRFRHSPNQAETQLLFDQLMDELGYDKSFKSIDYSNNSAAALGNHIAQEMISFGWTDGSNEQDAYNNTYYEPINEPLLLEGDYVANITDPNRWQPLGFEVYIDQSGNPWATEVPEFLGPEWGNVHSFCLKKSDLSTYERDGSEYRIFKDPGAPPTIDTEEYKWGFSLVSVWSSHLDRSDGVMIDISPASIGNIPSFPSAIEDYPSFYNLFSGGDASIGHALNPVTGQPYASQIVPRADYARILAEFWADGPASETPPGHWFTILNYVNDHDLFQKKMTGQGDVINDLEWDVKAYFMMGGAMHDSAIAAWGVKGWYDYIRPISAIRYMASLGQSTDTELENYHSNGIPLIENYIEVIQSGDPIAGEGDINVGKIKLYTWKGHDYIVNPDTDEAGVGWILSEKWWPYQRPSFVTPPFAGYVSGHSTYSRAAAEIMTLLTGSAYFPGGMGEFVAPKNEFLVFEQGPSVDVTLQWATYRDASDQCSLSRIWGGIHPPADDIPGRLMGEAIGLEAFEESLKYFNGTLLSVDSPIGLIEIYPNPTNGLVNIQLDEKGGFERIRVISLMGNEIMNIAISSKLMSIDISSLEVGIYFIQVTNNKGHLYTSRLIKE